MGEQTTPEEIDSYPMLKTQVEAQGGHEHVTILRDTVTMGGLRHVRSEYCLLYKTQVDGLLLGVTREDGAKLDGEDGELEASDVWVQ